MTSLPEEISTLHKREGNPGSLEKQVETECMSVPALRATRRCLLIHAQLFAMVSRLFSSRTKRVPRPPLCYTGHFDDRSHITTERFWYRAGRIASQYRLSDFSHFTVTKLGKGKMDVVTLEETRHERALYVPASHQQLTPHPEFTSFRARAFFCPATTPVYDFHSERYAAPSMSIF